MKMFAILVEWSYATPSIYTRHDLESAREKRDELIEEYSTARRIGIYEFLPLSTMPGTFMELPEEFRYPEKEQEAVV